MSWLSDAGHFLGGAVKGWFDSGKGVDTVANAIGGIGGWLATKKGAKQTHKYNLEYMDKQYGYNKKLMAKQFNYALQGQQEEARLNSYLQQQQTDAENALQKSAYGYQNALQNKQMQWEQMMSNTAHQREVSDLRQAGLNPILSANGGASTPSAGMGSIGVGSAGMASVGGASTGNGSVGLPSSPHPDYAQALQNAISNAFQDRQLDQEAEAIASTARLQSAQALTEENKRLNLDADTAYKKFQAITESFKPSFMKKQMEKMDTEMKLDLANAYAASVHGTADMMRARTEQMTGSADQALKKMQERAEKERINLMKSETKYNDEKSRGYTTSGSAFGISASHTGNQIKKGGNNNKGKRYYFERDNEGVYNLKWR